MLKSKLTKWLIIALIVCVAVIYFGSESLKKSRSEARRYQNNYEVVTQGLNEFIVMDSLQAIRVKQLELSKQELRDYYEGKLLATLKEMDIRLRKMESYSTTAIQTTNNINTLFRDSLVRDTIKIEKLTYRSKWFDIDVTKEGKNALIKAVSRDSITQVVSWDREGFWPIRFMKQKTYMQTVLSSNPNSIITYNRYIVPTKLHKE